MGDYAQWVKKWAFNRPYTQNDIRSIVCFKGTWNLLNSRWSANSEVLADIIMELPGEKAGHMKKGKFMKVCIKAL